jgi:hypothetical protein
MTYTHSALTPSQRMIAALLARTNHIEATANCFTCEDCTSRCFSPGVLHNPPASVCQQRMTDIIAFPLFVLSFSGIR